MYDKTERRAAQRRAQENHRRDEALALSMADGVIRRCEQAKKVAPGALIQLSPDEIIEVAHFSKLAIAASTRMRIQAQWLGLLDGVIGIVIGAALAMAVIR